VIDAHVHLLPPRLQAAIREFFAARGFPARDFAYPADPGEVCARLAADGITGAWTLPYARRPGTAAELNASMAALVREQRGGPVRLTGGCTVHPGDENPVAVLRTAVEDLGLRVVKLHCSVGGYQPDDPRLDPVWEYVSQVAVPVVLHAGHAPDGHTEEAELRPVAEVARRHPEARVIIAHCGHTAAAAALRLAAGHPGIHADLTPVIHDPVAVAPDRLAALAGKLLFGSDAPNTGWTAARLLDRLAGAALPDEARTAITGGTARRLLSEVRA
jgi:predicted TIM-barrel fold metal-dependent hydrolase